MNGDWMEYEAQQSEMAESGPLLSSYAPPLNISNNNDNDNDNDNDNAMMIRG
jgi:hypothetical protein